MPVIVDRRTAFDQLPSILTTNEVQAYLGCGRTAAFRLMQRFGVKVGARHRMPKTTLVAILSTTQRARWQPDELPHHIPNTAAVGQEMTVDMSRFTVKYLANADLPYIGVLVRVVVRHADPVVEFRDGVRWVPGQRCRTALMNALGPDTGAWTGQRLRVFLHDVTGHGVEKYVEALGRDTSEAQAERRTA